MIPMWTTVLLAWMFPFIQTAPAPTEMVDMSYVFDNTTLHWPTNKKFDMTLLFNSTRERGYWLQTEEYVSQTHVGTHMDAPCHFSKGGWTMDKIPLSHLIAPAAVIDITEQAEEDRDYQVQITDLEKWEKRCDQNLNGTIIMIRSGWGRRWGDRESFIGTADDDITKLHFPGVSKEAAQWLVDNRSIYGLGTEALSLDYGQTREFWAHRILLGTNIYGLENVANMEKIPIFGATLHVLPMKIGRASGAPVRILASYPKITSDRKGIKCSSETSYQEVIILNK